MLKEMFAEAIKEDQNPDEQSKETEDEAKKRREKFMEILNEKMADNDQEGYANLLAKQFIEKDGNMKLLLQKYSDQKLNELDAIKLKFRRDKKALEDLKDDGKIDEETYKDRLNKMNVDEANMARDLMLNMEKAHKDEEAAIRDIFNKKHTEEQIALRKKQREAAKKLRQEMFTEKEAQEEEKVDENALAKFEAAKKADMEKRQRSNDIEKR